LSKKQEAPKKEAALTDKKAAPKKGGKKTVVFGGVILLFAVIGLITSLRFVVLSAGDMLNHTKEKESFALLVTPLVLQDPPTFASPEEAADSTIITAAAWRLIMQGDIAKYPVDEFNFITVPQSDIEVQIKALFGEVEYKHQSVGDTQMRITYSRSDKSYTFPARPYVMSYTPRVEEIRKITETEYCLTVGYISPGLSWESDLDGETYHSEPEKIMNYTVIKEDSGYRIYAIERQDDLDHSHDHSEETSGEED